MTVLISKNIQRFLGLTSAVAAAISLIFAIYSFAGARPFEQSSMLFAASIVLVFITSIASERVLSPHLKAQPLIRKLTLQPILPKWAAIAVWVVIVLGILVVQNLKRIGELINADNSLSLLTSVVLLVFFFGNAAVLLLVSDKLAES